MKLRTQIKAFFCESALVISAAFILCIGAFWNGYPLIFHDSYSYIADGFSGRFQGVHPVGYTLFVKYTSLLGYSLFGTVVAQAVLFSFLWRRIQVESTKNSSGFIFLLGAALAALFAGGTWILSLLVADAMTPIFVVASVLLCIPSARSKMMNVAIVAIFLFSGICHLSHLGIAGLGVAALLVALFAIKILKRPQHLVTVKGLLKKWSLLVVALFFSACSINFLVGGSFKPAQALAPHILGRLAEAGSLGRLLREDCKNTDYLFCKFWPKDLESMTAKQFIWERESPLFATKRQEDNKEYSQMIKDSVLQHPLDWLGASLKSTFTQLIGFRLGDRIFSYLNNPWNAGAIHRFFNNEFESFKNARQQNNTLSFFWPNVFLFIGLGVLGLFCIFAPTRQIIFKTPIQKSVWIFMGLTIFLNAVFCGIFTSGLLERYQARVIWLLPAYLGLLLVCKLKQCFPRIS